MVNNAVLKLLGDIHLIYVTINLWLIEAQPRIAEQLTSPTLGVPAMGYAFNKVNVFLSPRTKSNNVNERIP